MKLVIDIPDEVYNFTIQRGHLPYGVNIAGSIIDGEVVEEHPTVEQSMDEWCIDCKEYDHEKNCCPRFNRVIRETLKEVIDND